MAVQTIETLKAAFSAGKIPTEQNWADLIDSIFAQGGNSQIFSMTISGYDSSSSQYVQSLANSDIKLLSNVRNYTITVDGVEYNTGSFCIVPLGSCWSSKFVATSGEPHILMIHNNSDVTFYVPWSAECYGEQVYLYSGFDTRYFEYDSEARRYVPKTQLVVIPSGCSVAFGWSVLGGYQPAGNFTSYDYNTLVQEIIDSNS